MADDQALLNTSNDGLFRKGAYHGGEWFLETLRTLAAQGRSAGEIADHLADLSGILADWRNDTTELPDGNPWDWSFKDLACVIKTRKEG